MKKLFLPLTVFFIMLLSFQNCGKVNVSAVQPSVAPEVLTLDKPSYELCPVAGLNISVPITYVFIVDMSLSNMGGFVQRSTCEGQSSKYNYYLGLANATDHTLVSSRSRGQRLESIGSFIDQVADANPNIRYSVIGFSTNKMLGGPEVSCAGSATGEKATFLQRLQVLKNIQHSDYSKNGTCSYNSPFQMGSTSYMSGLNCLSENIEAEKLLSGASRSFYQTFFITDGKPNEKDPNTGRIDLNKICDTNTVCRSTIQACLGTANEEACVYDYVTATSYVPKVQSLVAGLVQDGFGFNLKPIYYEKPNTLPASSDFSSAKISLDRLAQADGSTTTTSKLTDLNSLIDEFRDALGPQATINYSFTSPLVVNVNSLPTATGVSLDSDGDGVSDALEDSLVAKGFDKLNPRSMGILDGICLQYFNGDNCAPAVSADCAVQLGYGLTKCDADKLKTVIPEKTLTGFDSDLDGVIDFIEIIKGTNPLFSDYNLDDDSDGLGNITEIYQGSDPLSAKAMYKEFLTRLNVQEILQPATTQCLFPGTSLRLSIDNIALIPALPQNKVIVSIIAEPTGSMNPKRRLYIGTLLLGSDGKFDKLQLGNQDIQLIGEF